MSANNGQTDPLRCIAVSLKPDNDTAESGTNGSRRQYSAFGRTEREIFQDFIERNRTCYWNPHLRESIESLRFAGYLCDPPCLLLSGRDIYLDTLLTAWSTRILRPPPGFIIDSAGEISGLDIHFLSQTPYTPLTDILCMIISDCNRVQVCATFDVILAQLGEHFSSIQPPSETIVYRTLDQLLKDRKIYHSGNSYYVVTPDALHLSGCVVVRDDHLILGNASPHANGLPTICIPLQGANKKTSPEQKSTSCQTEVPESNQTSRVDSLAPSGGSDKPVKHTLVRSASIRKSKREVDVIVPSQPGPQNGKVELSGKTSDISTPKNSADQPSIFKRLLCRSKTSNGEIVNFADGNNVNPRPATPSGDISASKPKHTNSQPLHHLKSEECKELAYGDDADSVTKDPSGLFGRGCLGFSARKKVSGDADKDTAPLNQKPDTQRSRSMSPDSRTSPLSLSSDENPRPNTNLLSPGEISKFKSTESLHKYHACDCQSDSFELEPVKPSENVRKAKKTVHRRFPDSYDYVSRAFKKYRRLKGLSLQREDRRKSVPRKPVYHVRRSLSHDSGLNDLTKQAQDETISRAFSQFQKSRTVDPANTSIGRLGQHHTCKAKVHPAGMEDSGFLSFSSPVYLPMDPGRPFPSGSMLKNSVPKKFSGLESSRNFPLPKTVDSELYGCNFSSLGKDVLAMNSNRLDSVVENCGLVADSCPTGSSWSNSSRHTIINASRKIISDAAPRETSKQESSSLPPEPFPSLVPLLSLKMDEKVARVLSDSSRVNPGECNLRPCARTTANQKQARKKSFRKTDTVVLPGRRQ